MRTLIEQHASAARILVLAAVFASGCVEAFVWKSRDVACATWFGCLIALTVWIAFAGTLMALVAAVGTFAVGVLLIVAYYQCSESE